MTHRVRGRAAGRANPAPRPGVGVTQRPIGAQDLATALDAVRTGPQGPRVAAIFDFGGTVVHGFNPPPLARR
ncbi:hypothetical protein ACWELJ_28455, partial [Nocardia sp. NPDC004582]